jgi:hypothetical protein
LLDALCLDALVVLLLGKYPLRWFGSISGLLLEPGLEGGVDADPASESELVLVEESEDVLMPLPIAGALNESIFVVWRSSVGAEISESFTRRE